MTEADIWGFESPLKETVKIQKALEPLGYEIRGFRKKYRNAYEFVLRLKFVGPSVFAGDDFGRPADRHDSTVCQNPGDCSRGKI
jgi:hypothetical protein